MVLVGSGLLEAVLEARGTPGLVVCCNGEVIAITSRTCALLEAPSGTEVPHGIRAFAAAVMSLGGAQSMEVRVGSKRIKMSGIAYADTECGKKFAILSLEELQRPWDQIADREVRTATSSFISLVAAHSRRRAGTRCSCRAGLKRSMRASAAMPRWRPSFTSQTPRVRAS